MQKYMVSKTEVPFDVLYNAAIEKGIEKPVMCIPTGDYQVAIEHTEFDYDMAIDIAITMDSLLESGISTDTDDCGSYGGDRAYEIIMVPVDRGIVYYFVVPQEY